MFPDAHASETHSVKEEMELTLADEEEMELQRAFKETAFEHGSKAPATPTNSPPNEPEYPHGTRKTRTIGA